MRSTRVRALLSLGILLGFGSLGTFAYFSDSATMAGATFTSGTLDIEVNGEADDSYTWSAFTLSDMMPGESRAASVEVKNVGSVPFTYTASGSGTGALLPALRFTFYADGVADNAPVNNLRTGSCTGDQVGEVHPLTASDQLVIPVANKQQLSSAPADNTQNLCVVASLSSDAGNAYQGTTADVTFTLNALQLGAP